MIQKHYKKGMLLVCCSVITAVVGVMILGLLMGGNYRKFGECACVLLSLFGVVMSLFGCSELLLAKGYDTSMMLAFLIPGICCSGIFILVAPFVIIYGLEDKTKRRDRY